MNAKENAAAVSDSHLQLQYELADACAETAALNEQLVIAREVLALQRTPQPQPQLLVLVDSFTHNAFTSDKISDSNTANKTNANAIEELLPSSAATRTLSAEAVTLRALLASLWKQRCIEEFYFGTGFCIILEFIGLNWIIIYTIFG